MNKNLGKMEEIKTRCGKFEKSNSNCSKTGYNIFETKRRNMFSMQVTLKLNLLCLFFFLFCMDI